MMEISVRTYSDINGVSVLFDLTYRTVNKAYVAW
jgi:hypothetical protein